MSTSPAVATAAGRLSGLVVALSGVPGACGPARATSATMTPAMPTSRPTSSAASSTSLAESSEESEGGRPAS